MKVTKQTAAKAASGKGAAVPPAGKTAGAVKALTPSLSTFAPLGSTVAVTPTPLAPVVPKPASKAATPTAPKPALPTAKQPKPKVVVITEVPNQVEMRVLKVGSCPSMSGKSDLSYQLGCRVDALTPADVQFRVVANSGGGFFSDEWVPLAAIKKAISKATAGELTSFNLYSLFEGKSINTLHFCLRY